MLRINRLEKKVPSKPGMATDLTEQEKTDRFGHIGASGVYKFDKKKFEADQRRSAELGAHPRVLADDFPEQDERESLEG